LPFLIPQVRGQPSSNWCPCHAPAGLGNARAHMASSILEARQSNTVEARGLHGAFPTTTHCPP
jgi:hypothetical protein